MSGNRFANVFFSVYLTIAVAGVTLAQEPTDSSAFPMLHGPYLGQAPPGLEPQLFAEGIIPIDDIEHCFPTFSPDGREVYWMTMVRGSRPKIMGMREVDGSWTPPEVAPFSGEFPDMAPAFSPDGSRLYFASARPGGLGKADIWYMNRTDSGWSAPINPGAPLNSAESESQPTATNDGTVYFVGPLADVKWGRGIYRAALVDGHFADPVVLPPVINSEHAESYPFIAPDESYLLFGSTRPSNWISCRLFRRVPVVDSTWSSRFPALALLRSGETERLRQSSAGRSAHQYALVILRFPVFSQIGRGFGISIPECIPKRSDSSVVR